MSCGLFYSHIFVMLRNGCEQCRANTLNDTNHQGVAHEERTTPVRHTFQPCVSSGNMFKRSNSMGVDDEGSPCLTACFCETDWRLLLL